jgi:acetyl-CoA carboxylase biotin carboxyl carrier protein
MRRNGRVFEKISIAPSRRVGDRIVVVAPQPGLYRGGPLPGSAVHAHAPVGELEILGTLQLLRADADAHGLVVSEVSPSARRAVGFGDTLFELDPSASVGSMQQAAVAAQASGGGLRFLAPSSGRFYSCPAPGKAPFVSVGQILAEGQPVALLEVMKTFNRIAYGGPGLPQQVRVLRILVEDGADVEMGQPLLEIEAAAG